MLRYRFLLALLAIVALPMTALADDPPAEDPDAEIELTLEEEYPLVGMNLAYQLIHLPANNLRLSYEDAPKQGILVKDVFPGSQAEADGFLPDDLIYRFDDDEIDSIDELLEDMIQAPIEGTKVRVYRQRAENGKVKEEVVELIFHPGDHYLGRINLLIFDYSRTEYFKHYNVLFYLMQYRRARNAQYFSFIPILYQYRRVSTRTNHRFFWFLNIQSGGSPPVEVDF